MSKKTSAPAAPALPTVVNVGYRSTNFWVISAGTSRILVDLGWPGMFGTLKANLERMNVPMKELKYAFATHYHMDHAGCAQDLKNAGVPLLVADVQVPFIPQMKAHIKPDQHFTDISLHDNVVISCAESRVRLKSIGIDGELVHTPGHSDDSVSLLLDTGAVFIGDLTIPRMSDDPVVHASWKLLIDKGANTVYPGHGNVGRL